MNLTAFDNALEIYAGGYWPEGLYMIRSKSGGVVYRHAYDIDQYLEKIENTIASIVRVA